MKRYADMSQDETQIVSPTEGVLTHDFLSEDELKLSILQSLARFTQWVKNDYQVCTAPNSVGEACGCFKGENTMGNDEKGVRPNADLSMVCAFLVKYGKGVVDLPAGVTWDELEAMAMKTLVFAYSTHKANKLKTCSGDNYWGSVSTSDYAWESSLWAFSVAFSAYLQWDKLSTQQKGYVEKLLKAECNYELNRSIPTGYSGDTKAEENGWEADILAATLGLFPDDTLAPRWFERLRQFAINSYSHPSDATDQTVIDPDYDEVTVASLYRGANLYRDYTLQNHNYFHTSYQTSVIQESGEAALALALFQRGLHGQETWKTNALMHNNQKVQQEVLNWFSLPDGDVAMPNGNDWSIYLLASHHSTLACLLRNPDALLLESIAYKSFLARQQTTTDGALMLRSDVGARRMGCEAHKMVMTYLLHEMASTSDLMPTSFADYRSRVGQAHVVETQNVVRAFTPYRYTTFGWSTGLSSYTGYFVLNAPDKTRMVVPFRANNTGNLLGWYDVKGKKVNATPAVSGIYRLQDEGYVMNGELSANDGALSQRFALYSTPGNALIYLDHVKATQALTVTAEHGGLLAVSVDEYTRQQRTLYYEQDEAITHRQSDGSTLNQMNSRWINIDNTIGVLADHDGKVFSFGERFNNNSVMSAQFCAAYSNLSRTYQSGQVVDARQVVYYSLVDAATTQTLSRAKLSLKECLPQGWNGVIVADPDQTHYALVSNFAGDGSEGAVTQVMTALGAPVFSVPSVISAEGTEATFKLDNNHSVADVLRFFLTPVGGQLRAVQEQHHPDAVVLEALTDVSVMVKAVTDSAKVDAQQLTMRQGDCVRLYITDSTLHVDAAEQYADEPADTLLAGYTDVTEQYLQNASFEQDATYGTLSRNVTVNGVTYAECYTNNVGAIQSKWPNILPVKGWTPANKLTSGSNYCRMFSMPTSTTLFCVSPSNVGNYATQVFPMLTDSEGGERALCVLNSWDKGQNAITQSVSLPAGRYRLLVNMRYDCPNQMEHQVYAIKTPSNTNTSLTGVRCGGKQNFRFPSVAGEWQTLAFDFEQEKESSVEISMGYETSASVGAAHNTYLNIDHVRLLKADDELVNGITTLRSVQPQQQIVDLQGRRLDSHRQPMAPGIYIVNGRKMIWSGR